MPEKTFTDQQSRNERDDRKLPSRIQMLLLAIIALSWLLLSFDLTTQYSPTIDEVPHAGSGWAIRAAGDYRVNPEHPPLWKILSALPHSAEALPREFDSRAWTSMTSSFILEWAWSANLLYEPDPARGVRYIQQARLPAVLFGLLLG
ncbi:MAG: hypothetical protein KY432_03565, partial [Acidobacteria bacterium]|nr:hypothetical protein [Acidobacteriota bacterium]